MKFNKADLKQNRGSKIQCFKFTFTYINRQVLELFPTSNVANFACLSHSLVLKKDVYVHKSRKIIITQKTIIQLCN